MTKRKHIEWFYQGARTLRAVARERGREDFLTTPEDWYLCPLCLDVLLTVDEFETGELTVEHVPPEALGGGDLVLTCKACNNDAGTYFDGQAHRQERLRQLLSGQSDRPETVTFTVDDFPTRVEMRTAGRTGMLFTVIPQINNPAAVELAIEHMRVLSETRSTDFRFTVTPQVRYHPDRARLAWIRAAYLAAFALFGWTYILQPALQPIRDQLRNPSTPGLPPLSMYNPDGDPDRREIWIIKRPAEHQSLLVVAGQHGVFLPLPNDPRSLDELARSLGTSEDGPVSYSFTGDMFPWPSKPEYLLDPPPVTDHQQT